MGVAYHCTETYKVFINTLGHIAFFLQHKEKLIHQSLVDTLPSEWVLFMEAFKNKPERLPYFASVGTIGIAIVLDGTLSDSYNEVIEESSHIFFTSFFGSLFLLLALFFLFALLLSDFGKHYGFYSVVNIFVVEFALTKQFFQCMVDGAHLTINSLPVFGSIELLQTCSIFVGSLPYIAVDDNSRINILVNFGHAFSYSNEQCSLLACAFSQKVVAHNFFLYVSSANLRKLSDICHHIFKNSLILIF